MYSLEQLQQKTFRQLKEIGWELNVLPEGDRRCRQNWIDVIVGVNPPLLELLETSSAAEVGSAADEPEFAASDRFVFVGSRRFLVVESVMDEAVDMETFGEPVYPEWPEGWLPAAEKSLDVDRPPTEPSIKLSDRFLNLYASPSFSAAHNVEPDGQLKLLERVTDPEPPDPDFYSTLPEFWAVMNAWNATYTDTVEQFKDLDVHQQNNAESSGTDTESVGADEIAIATELPSGCDCCAKLHGTGGDNQNEGLGSQKGDRLLEESRPNPRDTGRVLSHQPPELATQATFNDEQPPNRGDGRSRISSVEPAPAHFKPGTTVGHKSGSYLGEIEKIYYSDKRRKWRAKVGLGNYDLDNLVEQKVLPWDYPKPFGNWIKTGSMTLRCDICDIWTRKSPTPQAPTEKWTLAELAAKPIWQLKAIAKRCCEIIPGGHPRTKRAYIRAILAEQELRAIALEKEPLAPKSELDRALLLRVQNSTPAKKQEGKKRAKTAQTPEPLGQQLSLNLFSVAY